MDIKTRLENEELFDSQNAKGKNRIISLNEKGIYTIEDFINCDIASIVTTSYIRRYYMALQHALKYKYKGEPLVLDVLLDKKHSIRRSRIGIGIADFRISVMGKLGYEIQSSSLLAKKIVKKKMIDNDDYYQHSLSKNGGVKQEYYIVSVMDILNALAQSGDRLAQFYVAYKEKVDCQEKKEVEETQQQPSSETLEALKNTIVLLTSQRDELDKKISQLTEQVNTLEGGNIVNGK